MQHGADAQLLYVQECIFLSHGRDLSIWAASVNMSKTRQCCEEVWACDPTSYLASLV